MDGSLSALHGWVQTGSSCTGTAADVCRESSVSCLVVSSLVVMECLSRAHSPSVDVGGVGDMIE